MISSPLTGGATRLVNTISTNLITKLYAPVVDVRRFFTKCAEVQVYECLDTGYRFYHPDTIAGDSDFYGTLAKEALYYIPWKWEHEVTDTYIAPGDIVLELGCATGDFLLAMIRRKEIKAFGTELSVSARQTAEARGISFTPIHNANVTCAFQVLEHISDVRGFIQHTVDATKPGGYIIFGIPNNDCFIKDDPTCYLNMPPHHMGLWTRNSLQAITQFFPLDVVDIKTECLQPHHYRYYYQVRFGDKLRPLGFIGKVLNKALYELIARPLIALRAQAICGHTIIVIYRKRA
jgi:SAM-dependent methyltransferase